MGEGLNLEEQMDGHRMNFNIARIIGEAVSSRREKNKIGTTE